MLAQHVGDGEDDIRRGDARGRRAGQLEAHHPRDEHRHRLPKHRGLGLNAADAPAQDTQAVDHRRVRVSAHAGVGVGQAVADHDGAGQALDVDLVDDAGARRDNLELLERRLPPAQELVALAVAGVLQLDVLLEGARVAEDVNLHRVVDDQLGRSERVDLGRVAAERDDGLTHGRQVDNTRHAGEVLHDDAGGGELDLCVRVSVLVPVADGPDVLGGDVRAVLGPQEILQENLQAVGQRRAPIDRSKAEDRVGRITDLQLSFGPEAVHRCCDVAHVGSLPGSHILTSR